MLGLKGVRRRWNGKGSCKLQHVKKIKKKIMHYMWPVLISLLRIHIQPKSFGTEYRCCRKKYIVLFTTMANIREIKNFKVIGCLASINDCARGIQFISLFHGFVFMFCVI